MFTAGVVAKLGAAIGSTASNHEPRKMLNCGGRPQRLTSTKRHRLGRSSSFQQLLANDVSRDKVSRENEDAATILLSPVLARVRMQRSASASPIMDKAGQRADCRSPLNNLRASSHIINSPPLAPTPAQLADGRGPWDDFDLEQKLGNTRVQQPWHVAESRTTTALQSRLPRWDGGPQHCEHDQVITIGSPTTEPAEPEDVPPALHINLADGQSVAENLQRAATIACAMLEGSDDEAAAACEKRGSMTRSRSGTLYTFPVDDDPVTPPQLGHVVSPCKTCASCNGPLEANRPIFVGYDRTFCSGGCRKSFIITVRKSGYEARRQAAQPEARGPVQQGTENGIDLGAFTIFEPTPDALVLNVPHRGEAC